MRGTADGDCSPRSPRAGVGDDDGREEKAVGAIRAALLLRGAFTRYRVGASYWRWLCASLIVGVRPGYDPAP